MWQSSAHPAARPGAAALGRRRWANHLGLLVPMSLHALMHARTAIVRVGTAEAEVWPMAARQAAERSATGPTGGTPLPARVGCVAIACDFTRKRTLCFSRCRVSVPIAATQEVPLPCFCSATTTPHLGPAAWCHYPYV